MLNKMPKLPQIKSALLTMDENLISKDVLEQLRGQLPTEAEIASIQVYNSVSSDVILLAS